MSGTYELSVCLKRNAASVVLTMLGGTNTQTLLSGKKTWTLCTCRWWGCEIFPIFPSSGVLALTPHMSHLVKLSLPNIYLLFKNVKTAISARELALHRNDPNLFLFSWVQKRIRNPKQLWYYHLILALRAPQKFFLLRNQISKIPSCIPAVCLSFSGKFVFVTDYPAAHIC